MKPCRESNLKILLPISVDRVQHNEYLARTHTDTRVRELALTLLMFSQRWFHFGPEELLVAVGIPQLQLRSAYVSEDRDAVCPFREGGEQRLQGRGTARTIRLRMARYSSTSSMSGNASSSSAAISALSIRLSTKGNADMSHPSGGALAAIRRPTKPRTLNDRTHQASAASSAAVTATSKRGAKGEQDVETQVVA